MLRLTMLQLLRNASLMVLLMATLLGCATLSGRTPPSARVVGLEPIQSEGLELRFSLQLRLQNPNDSALPYDGMSVSLDLDGRGLASGVSDVSGVIPRFGETVLSIPVSISAFSAVRQILARVGDAQDGNSELFEKPLAYSLKGKLGGTGLSAATRFNDQGELNLFATGVQAE